MAKQSTIHTATGADLTRKDVDEAHKDAALDYIKDGAKAAMITDTGTAGDSEASAEASAKRIAPDANTTFLAPFLDLPVDTFVQRLSNEKLPDAFSLETAKGLLALERAGANRTSYVQPLMKRIGVESPYEVTNAGPPFTNDTSNVTAL